MGYLKEWLIEKEEEIRKEVEQEFPHFIPEQREAIVRSRILILSNKTAKERLDEFMVDRSDPELNEIAKATHERPLKF